MSALCPGQQAQALLLEVESVQSYLRDWQVAGPYMQEGRNYAQLFDIPFAPEKPGAEVEWKAIGVRAEGNHPAYVDLLDAFGGEQRVAYMRTRIEADREGPARLELWFTPADGGPSPEDLPLDVELPALAAGQQMPISVLTLWGSGVYSFSGQARPGISNSEMLDSGDIPFDAGLCEEAADEPGDAHTDNDQDDPSPAEEPGDDQAGEDDPESGSSSEEEPDDEPEEEPTEGAPAEEAPLEDDPPGDEDID